MSVAIGIAAVLLLGVLCTMLAFRRNAALYSSLRVLLSVLSAALLWLALFPPTGLLPARSEPVKLVLLSAQSDLQRAAELQREGARLLALPEARLSATSDTSRISNPGPVADLASVLRRYPQASELYILGQGLPARDLRARLNLPVHFALPAEAAGLRHWAAPASLVAGSEWTVSGEVGGVADARVVLLDPAGARVGSANIDAAGQFNLSARVRSPGRLLYTLQVWTSQTPPVLHEALPLPLLVEGASPAKVLLLAGAPSPELKYLRRWAVDAGLALSSRMALGLNMQIGAARPPANADEWAQWDLLVLDERSLASLGSAGRQTVEAAVRAGMGLLLRLTGPMANAEGAWLQQLGMSIQPTEGSSSVAWALPEGSLQLQQRPLSVQGPLLLPLLTTPAGSRVGAWQPLGRGRIGVLWLTDSYQLQLNGFAELHAGIWQQAFGRLLRARAEPQAVWLQSADPLRVDQRVIWCGLDAQRRYTLHSPASAATPLLIDPATPGCAAAWPSNSGWAELRDEQGWLMPLYVHAAQSAPAQAARQQAQATLAMAMNSGGGQVKLQHLSEPGPVWPWWLSWLLCSGALWWLERRAPGRAA